MAVKDDSDLTMMSTRERAICSSLCLCLAISVLSSVAMIYLSVIIYIPSQREMLSGFNEVSVMCTTVENRRIHGDMEECKRGSCAEWCLSKGQADCTQLIVRVRANGTDVEFSGCSAATEKQCESLDIEAVERRNCKEDHQCTNLDRMFKCDVGLCYNISSVYSCFFDDEDADWPPVSCGNKRNCVELTGMFHCTSGMCRRVHKWSCERSCTEIPIADRNVITISGDHILSAKCHSAFDVRTGEAVWKGSDHPDTALMSSCTTVTVEGDVVKGWDCINGSVIPSGVLGSYGSPKGDINYTQLMAAFTGHGHLHRIDARGAVLPFDVDVTIYDDSKLMINHEGCSNTLQKECEAFYSKFGRDGRNHSSPSRYPCFYAPNSPEVVVARFDLAKTQYIFLMFFIVPASLCIVSCSVLLLCSRILNIDNTGHMALRKWGDGDEQDPWEQELAVMPQRKPTMRRPMARRKSIFDTGLGPDTGEDDL